MRLNSILKTTKLLLIILSGIAFAPVYAQSVLQRNITIHVNHQRLDTVLRLMEQTGKFNFSYNSNLIKKDSLVTMQASNETVKDALDQLLNNRFEYRESQNFIILRYAPNRLSLQMDKVITDDNSFHINGYVINEQTGQKLMNASVYERYTLESAVTDRNGYFDMKIKNENHPITLTAGKENYRDTTIMLLSEVIVRDNYHYNPSFSYLTDDPSKFENSGIVRLFTSSKQKIQSINLGGLITQQPFQASLVPGLSSHGSLSGQVVNKASLNLLGGYNAGTDGVEIAGLFNLDKSDVRFIQLAGLFNVVGGSVSGVQIGQAFNQVLTNVSGVQLAGAFNNVEGSLSGVGLTVGLNHSNGLNGVQMAALNISEKNAKGSQIGLVNISTQKFNGIQLGGLFNYAKDFKGIQIGLINTSDFSTGASIGLINLVQHGYKKTVINTNETIKANLLFKTGTPLLYNIYVAGANVSAKNKLFAGGMGFGNEYSIFNWLAINTEATSRYIYLGVADRFNLLNRLDIGINIRLGKLLHIISGPSLNYYYSDQKYAANGYAFINSASHYQLKSNKYFTRWYGWTFGFTLF